MDNSQAMNFNNEQPELVLNPDELMEILKSVLKGKERHKTLTVGGGTSTAGLDLLDDNIVEHKHIFLLINKLHSGELDFNVLSKKVKESIDKWYFNNKALMFHYNKEDSVAKYDHYMEGFISKCFGDPSARDNARYNTFKKLLLQTAGVTGEDQTLSNAIFEDATCETREKAFRFLMHMSYLCRFFACKIEVFGAEEILHMFYTHMMEVERKQPGEGIESLKADKKEQERLLGVSEARFEQDKKDPAERKKKKRKLAYNQTETRDKISLDERLKREKKYYKDKIRQLESRIKEKELKMTDYRSRRPKLKVGKHLPDDESWREKRTALYACTHTKKGVKPFIVELVRSQDDYDDLNKIDYCTPKVNGDVHDKVTTYRYDGGGRIGKVIKMHDNLERSFEERRAKALKMAISAMEGAGLMDCPTDYDIIYPLGGMTRPSTDDVSSITPSQFRMARAGYGSNSATSSVDGGSSSSTTTTTTTTTTQKKNSP